ncbi:MAG: hypothetical protein ICV64_00530 [Thermoleophilia bacterium]|nr:hypothetical protein [Thermoleophilia bacterium]
MNTKHAQEELRLAEVARREMERKERELRRKVDALALDDLRAEVEPNGWLVHQLASNFLAEKWFEHLGQRVSLQADDVGRLGQQIQDYEREQIGRESRLPEIVTREP